MTIDTSTFRDRILKDLLQLADSFSEARESAGTVTLDQSSVGRLSRMDAMQQQAMAQGMRERMELRRRKLEGALAHIEAGTFGQCCECGSEIEPERPQSDPAALFCFDCKMERDSDWSGRDGH